MSTTMIAAHRLRLRQALGFPLETPVDVRRGCEAELSVLLGAPLSVEVGLFQDAALLAAATAENLLSLAVELKALPATGDAPEADDAPLISRTQDTINADLTAAAWRGGEPEDCHARVEFSAGEMSFEYPTDGRAWLVIAAEWADEPGVYVPLCAVPCTVVKTGFGTPGIVAAVAGRGVVSRADLTGLVGGAATDLDSLVTAGAGRVYPLGTEVRLPLLADGPKSWLLVADPHQYDGQRLIVEPQDYDADSNDVGWVAVD